MKFLIYLSLPILLLTSYGWSHPANHSNSKVVSKKQCLNTFKTILKKLKENDSTWTDLSADKISNNEITILSQSLADNKKLRKQFNGNSLKTSLRRILPDFDFMIKNIDQVNFVGEKVKGKSRSGEYFIDKHRYVRKAQVIAWKLQSPKASSQSNNPQYIKFITIDSDIYWFID